MRAPRLLSDVAGLLLAKGIGGWMNTLEYRAAYYDPAVDPVHPDCSGQKIYVFWHEYILLPLHMRGNCRLAMLISQHRDANLLERVALHSGFECVRGSSTRGGSTAIRELLRRSRDLNLAITPDGPRGPRRQLAPGAVYLASKLQLPIVAMGFGYDRAWRLGSWDKFAIPKPFAQARAIVSPELRLPRDLDREGVEHYRGHVEELLRRLTERAEAWALSGRTLEGEVPALKQSAPLPPPAAQPADEDFFLRYPPPPVRWPRQVA